MRDRLIELIQKYSKEDMPTIEGIEEWADDIADYILADGWIRPPCDVGDAIYLILTYNGKPYCGITEDKVQMIGITSRGIHIKARNHHDHNKMYMLDKTAFLRKEDAKRALENWGEN